jgi:hypothetical protein
VRPKGLGKFKNVLHRVSNPRPSGYAVNISAIQRPMSERLGRIWKEDLYNRVLSQYLLEGLENHEKRAVRLVDVPAVPRTKNLQSATAKQTAWYR